MTQQKFPSFSVQLPQQQYSQYSPYSSSYQRYPSSTQYLSSSSRYMPQQSYSSYQYQQPYTSSQSFGQSLGQSYSPRKSMFSSYLSTPTSSSFSPINPVQSSSQMQGQSYYWPSTSRNVSPQVISSGII